MTDLHTHIQTLRQQRDALPPGEDRDRLDDHLSDLEADLRGQDDDQCAVYPAEATYRLEAPGLRVTVTGRQFQDPDD